MHTSLDRFRSGRWIVLFVLGGSADLNATAIGQNTPRPPDAAPLTSTPDWPLLRHNSQNTGYSPAALPPPLRLRWRTRVHGAQFSANYYPHYHHGVPLALRSTVFVAAEVNEKTAPTLLALDAETGRVRWSYPEVVGVGSCMGGVLVTERIRVEAPEQPRGRQIRRSLVALDIVTGKAKWEFPSEKTGPYSAAEYTIPPYPQPGGKELLWLQSGELTVINLETGRSVRRDKPLRGLTGLPAIRDQLLVLHRVLGTEARGVHGGYVLFDNRTLQVKAEGKGGYAAPLLSGDFLVNGYGEYLGQVLVHRRTGEGDYAFAWSARSTAHAAYVAVPHRTGTRLVLYVPWDPERRRSDLIRAHDLRTGRKLWDYGPLSVTGYAAACRDAIYLPGTPRPRQTNPAGGLYALHAGTGRLLWKYERKGLRLTAPALTEHGLYASGSDGYLYAFTPVSRPKANARR